MCDRIIIIDHGKIIATGTSAELKKQAGVKKDATLNDVFLELTGKELRD